MGWSSRETPWAPYLYVSHKIELRHQRSDRWARATPDRHELALVS